MTTLSGALRRVQVGPFGPNARSVINGDGRVGITPEEADEFGTAALGWFAARLADPAMVKAVALAFETHWQFFGGCRCGWTMDGHGRSIVPEFKLHIAQAALTALATGLGWDASEAGLGLAGGEG